MVMEARRMHPLKITYAAGAILIAFGVVVMFLGAAPSAGSFSAVIFIGPFPIVFGSGPGSGLLILISLILVALMLVISCVSVLLRPRRRM
jgi:uncharacterized membrane protein